MREKQHKKSELKEFPTKRSVIKSRDCNETLVARWVSEGGRGGRNLRVLGRCTERGEVRENFAKCLIFCN